MANLVAFLRSPGGGYSNDQTIALDGGRSTTECRRPEALFAERVGPQRVVRSRTAPR